MAANFPTISLGSVAFEISKNNIQYLTFTMHSTRASVEEGESDQLIQGFTLDDKEHPDENLDPQGAAVINEASVSPIEDDLADGKLSNPAPLPHDQVMYTPTVLP